MIKFAISSQSPQALWPAVGRQERLWGIGILLPHDFRGKTMQAIKGKPINNGRVTGQPMKNGSRYRATNSTIEAVTGKPIKNASRYRATNQQCKTLQSNQSTMQAVTEESINNTSRYRATNQQYKPIQGNQSTMEAVTEQPINNGSRYRDTNQ